jgi:di/tricarboxylate transporter
MDKNISNYHTFTYFYVVISIKYYFCQKFTMTFAAIATIVIICLALILFITEVLSIDIVALLVLTSFVLLGVITPEEGVAGFSNKATVTVMFLFILSTALLKTGALQYLANSLSKIFIRNFNQGMLLMMFLIAFVSAFINNTPVVAVFIPVILQIAHTSGQSPMKMLIPLSFASIFGGMTTLIGTSTNILVSGIIASEGLPELKMFQLAPIGIVLFLIGTAYIIFFGKRLLPERNKTESLKAVSLRNYISEIQILADSQAVGQSIMNADLVKELNMDVIEVRRGKSVFYLPQGDFIIAADDVRLRFKNYKLDKEVQQSILNYIILSEKMEEVIKKQDSKKIEETDGFLKFVTESREWAFQYIEDVQKTIVNLQDIAAKLDLPPKSYVLTEELEDLRRAIAEVLKQLPEDSKND